MPVVQACHRSSPRVAVTVRWLGADSPVFQCSSCAQQFMQKKDLQSHMIKLHGAPKPHAVRGAGTRWGEWRWHFVMLSLRYCRDPERE